MRLTAVRSPVATGRSRRPDLPLIKRRRCSLLEHRARNRRAPLREALTHLAADGQRLIALLIADPPLPHAEISAGHPTSAAA